MPSRVSSGYTAATMCIGTSSPGKHLADPGYIASRLLDFGPPNRSSGDDVVEKAAMAASPKYIAPEQARGPGKPTLTDALFLRAMVFGSSLGRAPFQIFVVATSIQHHLNTPKPRALEAVSAAFVSDELDPQSSDSASRNGRRRASKSSMAKTRCPCRWQTSSTPMRDYRARCRSKRAFRCRKPGRSDSSPKRRSSHLRDVRR